jgi:cardiolipin synthase
VDGVVGYIGGMNIAQRYIDGTGEQPWHDLHARVMGGAVQAMQHVFEEDWYFSTKLLLNQKKYYPQPDVSVDKACLAQVVTSSPASQWHNIMQGYVRILLEARKYVYMETPYFMPTEPILNAMRTAALSGVDVRLILPLHGDSKIVEWASQSYLSEVVKAGVKVYLYKAGFLHSKMLVSDDAVCTCGSSNVDFRSFENNFECNLFLYGEEMAKQMKNVFLSDQKDAMIITLSNLRRYKQPFMDRFMQSLSRLLSPLL